MKRLGFILVSFLLISNLACLAQGEFVVEIDTATGHFTKTGTSPIPGVAWIQPGDRTYDVAAGEYIFQGFTTPPAHLYFIDISNGTVVSNPVLPLSGASSAIRETQYDNSTGNLYGLNWDNNNQEFYLATVNRITGVHTNVGTQPIAGLTATMQGFTSFDEIHHRYIHLVGKQLVTIDASTGLLLYDQMLNLNTMDYMTSISYNNEQDKLYGVRQENGITDVYRLCTIDPATGIVTDIGNGTFSGAGNGTGAIDTVLDRYIYIYYNGGNHTFIGGFDLATGELIFHHQVPVDSGDNVNSIVYDGTRGKLLAKHWDAVITKVNSPSSLSNLKIYPVPADDLLTVALDKQYDNISLQLISMTGQEVRFVHVQDQQLVELNVKGLAPGIYALIASTGQSRVMRKLVVE